MNRKHNPWVTLVALLLLATVLLCVCTGCSSEAAAAETDSGRFICERASDIGINTVRIITDTETGVQYLLISYGQGVGVTVLQPAPESEGGQ